MDLLGGQALVTAVVGLLQQGRDLRIGKAGPLGGATRPLHGARIDGVEMQSAEAGRERPGFCFALLRQGYVGLSGVAARGAPLRLAMPREVDL